ncbi:MAG: GTP cyclohydrolase II, partial [Pseudomonadota bacterium]
MREPLPHPFGDPRLLDLDRARAEWRAGRPIVGGAPGSLQLVAAVDTLRASALAVLVAGAPDGLRLETTAERARALGWVAEGPVVAACLPVDVTLDDLRALAGLGSAATTDARAPEIARGARLVSPVSGDAEAVALAKHARLLPTVVIAPASRSASAGVLAFDLAALAALDAPHAIAHERVGEARVPLAATPDARMVLFRDLRDAVEHVAVLVGDPPFEAVVETRVHSACLTGDLFGSLRCDCGDQLRGAVRRFAELGGGVLLYIAQEGRGIGLANKLRAYRLQDDAGLDTIEADRHLGFAGDERCYEVAARMLSELGVARVRLHTNNPRKIDALAGAGIEVAGFRTLAGAVTPHNERYLQVRRERAGHFTPDPE